MAFKTRREGDTGTVLVGGDLIVGNCRELQALCLDRDHPDLGSAKLVVVDFRSCGYIDADGLGKLVLMHKKLRSEGRDLKIANLNDDLKTLFELTRLDMLFEFVEDGKVPASAGTTYRPTVARSR